MGWWNEEEEDGGGESVEEAENKPRKWRGHHSRIDGRKLCEGASKSFYGHIATHNNIIGSGESTKKLILIPLNPSQTYYMNDVYMTSSVRDNIS